MVPDEMLLIELVEVIRAEVIVRSLVFENVVRNDEDGVGYGDNCLLPPSTLGQPLVPSPEVGVF